MPKLYVLTGKDLGAAFEVGDKAVIGRSNQCDVRLTDGSIGRRHARLEREGSHWHLIDLGSANGLRYDDEKMERVVLTDLDEVVLGRVRLRFREDKTEPEEPKVTAAPTRPNRPLVEPANSDDGPSLELEDDIDLSSLAPKSAPKESRESEPQTHATAHGTAHATDAQRADILRKQNPKGGFLTDALEDRPLWLSLILFLLVLALTSGLAYGMFRLVVGMRTG